MTKLVQDEQYSRRIANSNRKKEEKKKRRKRSAGVCQKKQDVECRLLRVGGNTEWQRAISSPSWGASWR